MNKIVEEISRLTAQLTPDARAVVEEKLVEETRKLVDAYHAELAARDDKTRAGLADIEAGRLSSLEAFQQEMKTFLNTLDVTADAR